MTPPRPLSRPGLLRLLALFAAVFAGLSLIDGFSFFEVTAFQLAREDTPRPVFNALVFAGSYLVGVAGLTVLYAHAAAPLRWIGYAISALACAMDLAFRSVNGYGFTYHEASLVWSEIDFIPSALEFFAASWVLPAAASFIGFFVFARLVRAYVPRLPALVLCVIPLVAVYAFYETLERTYSKVYQSPIPYRVPLLAYQGWQYRMPYYGEREPPLIRPAGEPIADHVVLIMDESVTGDLLGINGSELDTTPFLESVSDRLFNYGIASSISNLSSSTNLLLQSGLRPDQFPDRELRSLKNPNVFSYFQAAGFDAWLIDDQIYSGRPNNLMSGYDLRALDGHLELLAIETDATDWEIDLRAIDHLERIVRESDRSFVYLIKLGAHLPYDEKYPPQEKVFRPTLADGGEQPGSEKAINSYANAVRWTTDRFLRELFQRFEGGEERIVFVYTSDHGQSVRDAFGAGQTESGRPLRLPHSLVVDPPPRQAAVPLLLFGFGEGVEPALRALFEPALRDRVSQFELFPSLLHLAGYALPDVRRHYHHSLFEPHALREPRIFFSGNVFGFGGAFYDHSLVRDAGYRNRFELKPRAIREPPRPLNR